MTKIKKIFSFIFLLILCISLNSASGLTLVQSASAPSYTGAYTQYNYYAPVTLYATASSGSFGSTLSMSCSKSFFGTCDQQSIGEMTFYLDVYVPYNVAFMSFSVTYSNSAYQESGCPDTSTTDRAYNLYAFQSGSEIYANQFIDESNPCGSSTGSPVFTNYSGTIAVGGAATYEFQVYLYNYIHLYDNNWGSRTDSMSYTIYGTVSIGLQFYTSNINGPST